MSRIRAMYKTKKAPLWRLFLWRVFALDNAFYRGLLIPTVSYLDLKDNSGTLVGIYKRWHET